MKIRDRISLKVHDFLRRDIDKKDRSRLENRNFTLISSNCTGGIILHQLGLDFKTPTVNLYMNSVDFLKFCKDIKHYTESEMKLYPSDKTPYPIVKCDDILIHAVHYKSLEEFTIKWKKRCKRIVWDNIYILMSQRDGCTFEQVKEFDKLPFKNKVIFVDRNMPNIKSSIYIPGTEIVDDDHRIRSLTDLKSRLSKERLIDDFDYVTFFNTGELKLKRGDKK